MREWLVGGAVIETAAGVLLVENLRRDGRRDWSPPGGVIDDGEDVISGLGREVLEETGLTVVSWQGPIYEIDAEAPGLGWRLHVEVHRAVEVAGSLAVGDDPDGIVVGAAYLPSTDCNERLAASPDWVREPLVEWMGGPWSGSRSFRYLVEGSRLAELVVTRV